MNYQLPEDGEPNLIEVPALTNIYLSVYIKNDDEEDFKLAGYSTVYVNGANKYYNGLEFEDLKLGRGEDLDGKTLTALSSISKIKVDADDDDDLPNNCKVDYKIVLEAGDNLLWKGETSDSKHYSFDVTTTLTFKSIS